VREIEGTLVVDGLGIVLKMAETAVKIRQVVGTFVSRKMLYQMPGADVLAKAGQDYGIELS
jgi:hypothetical protein